MFTKLQKIKIILPLLIFILAFGWRLWGLNAQGETWDEIAYFNASKSYMRNIKNLDFDAQDWNANKEHPPIAKYIYGIASIKPFLEDKTDYTFGRFTSALMGTFTILLVFYLAKDLFSVRVATLSALILTFIPHFVGLNKVYGLDTPTCLFFVLTIYLFIKAILKSSNTFYILSGLSLGLAIATRYSNALLFILLPIIFFILKGNDIIMKGKERKFLWYILIIPFLAGLVLFLSWPWLWDNTIEHWNQTIKHWGGVKELYFGNLVSPGYSYYFVYFFICTPILILLLLVPYLIGTFKNFTSLFTAPKLRDARKNKGNFVILVWILVMFLVTFSPTKQNGVRYIIAIYPAVAIAASIGFFYLVKKRQSILISITVIIIYLIGINIYYHPYYLTYYNELIGGTKKVYEKKLFPIGWWGEGVEEACDWVSKQAKENSSVFVNSLPDHTTGGKLKKSLIKTSDNPDYIITNLHNIWYNQFKPEQKYKLIHTIKSPSVPFVFIYKRSEK